MKLPIEYIEMNRYPKAGSFGKIMDASGRILANNVRKSDGDRMAQIINEQGEDYGLERVDDAAVSRNA